MLYMLILKRQRFAAKRHIYKTGEHTYIAFVNIGPQIVLRFSRTPI